MKRTFPIRCRDRCSKHCVIYLGTIVILLLSGLFPLNAQIERQSLSGGGTLTGKLANPDAAPDEDYIVTLNETDTVILPHNLLRKKETLRSEAVEYRLTAPLTRDSVESHRQISEWCREKNMPIEARLHLERIIQIAPEDEQARKALGYEKRDGIWMTPKEKRESAGFVIYAGKSVTPQEAELLKIQDENKKSAAQWKKKIRSIQIGLKNDSEEAREDLRLVNAPEALIAVTGALREEKNPRNRELFVLAMGKIGTPAALGDLAAVAIGDDDEEVRRTAIEMILRYPQAIPGAVEYFRDILRHPEKYTNPAINRAGYALENLDAPAALPDLINALITRHTETIVIPGEQTSATFSSDGNISFNPGSQEKTKNVTQELENPEVLTAVRYFAASHYNDPVDFGFDIEAWKAWLAGRENLGDFRSRRDR